MRQTIDGFGASTRFGDGGRHELFFSSEKGIGLSLCRTPIPQDGTFPNLDIAKAAQSFGAKVWSASWSPPARMKSNNNVNLGGYLLPANYQGFADFLADFVDTAKAKGIDLHALSIQNEPNVSVEYASCIWNAQQFHDFIKNNLGPTFKRRSIATKILAPEYSGWNFDLADPTMDDSVSRNFISILGAHTYKPDDKTLPYQKALTYGKRQWQTEVCDVGAIDRSMDDALRWAREIHVMLTKTRINAWHYWLLDGATKNNNEGLWAQGPTKRLYAMGNYSKFARPGFVLVGTASTSEDILVTAFKDTASSGKMAIVAVNKSAAIVSCTFTLDRMLVKSLSPWETSSQFDLARRPDIQVVNNKFTVSLPAKSVTSFEGSEPILTRISLQPQANRIRNAYGKSPYLMNGMLVFTLEGPTLTGSVPMLPDGRRGRFLLR